MPYTIRFEEESGCIMVAVEGVLDVSVLKCLAADVAKIVEKNGCTCILNDLRGAHLRGVGDTWFMPQTATASGVQASCKRALLVREGSSEFDFLEMVFINRGHLVRTFTDIEAAKRWLQEG